jgi:hypothetical protein
MLVAESKLRKLKHASKKLSALKMCYARFSLSIKNSISYEQKESVKRVKDDRNKQTGEYAKAATKFEDYKSRKFSEEKSTDHRSIRCLASLLWLSNYFFKPEQEQIIRLLHNVSISSSQNFQERLQTQEVIAD